MEVYRWPSWFLLLLGVSLLATTLQAVQGEVESEGPSESECRPYIEKALKELETGEGDTSDTPDTGDSKEDAPTVEITTDDSENQDGDGDDEKRETGNESTESDDNTTAEQDQVFKEGEEREAEENVEATEDAQGQSEETDDQPSEEATDNQQSEEDNKSNETNEVTAEAQENEENTTEELSQKESVEDTNQSVEDNQSSTEDKDETEENKSTQEEEQSTENPDVSKSEEAQPEDVGSAENTEEPTESLENQAESVEDQVESEEKQEKSTEEGETSTENDEPSKNTDESKEVETGEGTGETEDNQSETEEDQDDSKQKEEDTIEEANDTTESVESENREKRDTDEDNKQSEEENAEASKEHNDVKSEESNETAESKDKQSNEATKPDESTEDSKSNEGTEAASDEGDSKNDDGSQAESTEDDTKSQETDEVPEEELSLDIDIPTELRKRDYVEQLLKLDADSSETEQIINRVSEITLRELKKLYENAIKPLEVLYKYRDLSNRHFGDPEIFSKTLILFMGPWSGGKSSIINYLVNNEYNDTSLKTGAEPSPAYFNILMYGDEPEIVEGTQLAADYTFSGLQKFGQGLEERLRGLKLPSKLLEKANIVEIPGILEVRKQVSRVFPFNDACQWFIDRADIIFLVYDPSKLDVGPETEAILDQLKGREHQTRIILNKADQVKPEELMRVQGALIWNISPLMSSPQPPIMYTTSLWSRPYEPWAPVRLLQAQERSFLRDLRSAIDKRIENKIASARRFAVRVRNHAKMVDCYLTTYYNHKSVFGNRKQVADEIIEHPQDYHIYEGLSTLTNISRYDLPDPDVYRDFFKLNPLYEFQQLSATCTYFRGCPINRLDIAIAYDLPELVGKHRRLIESALSEAGQNSPPGS